jgi:hypothetical protein
MALNKKDTQVNIRLLGKLKRLLESAIAAAVVPGETEPREAIDIAQVALDRIECRRIDELILKLEGVIR